MVDEETLQQAAEQLWAADPETALQVTAPVADLDVRLLGAQRFLNSTKSTVESTLASLKRVRRLRRTALGQAPQGQLSESDVDLLRTALLFAGAGLDATLKQAVRDAVPSIVETNEKAAEKLKRFTKGHVALPDGAVNAESLATILLADETSPRKAIVDAYASHLTADSAQSVERVIDIAAALGVTDDEVVKRIRHGKLQQAFKARNEIGHTLDLEPENQPGHFGNKRHRPLEATIGLVREVLDITQLILNKANSNLVP